MSRIAEDDGFLYLSASDSDIDQLINMLNQKKPGKRPEKSMKVIEQFRSEGKILDPETADRKTFENLNSRYLFDLDMKIFSINTYGLYKKINGQPSLEDDGLE